MIERHVKLIQLMIINRNHFLSADEIAKYLNVSNRTARNDIQYINSEILETLIISVKGRGYKLNQDLYNMQEIEAIVTEFTNKESELLIKLGYQLLMYQQPMTIEGIGTTFHLTKGETTDYLNKIKAWCTSFEVNIQITKKKGITVNGSEMNIRNAILHLNQLSENVETVDALILNEIPKAHIDIITRIIEVNLNKHRLYTSKIRITQLLIHLIIIFKRNNDDGQSWVVDDTSYQIAQQCIKEMNHELGYSLNEETAKLFSFFISYYFNQYDLGFEKLFVKTYIERMIVQMEKHVGVAFTQDQMLRENVHEHFSRTYLRIAKNVYINNPLTDDIKKHYPFIFNALYETVMHLEKDAEIHLVEDEIAFLALHFQSSIDRNKKDKFNIVITCYYGLGISSLLEAKLTNLDDSIVIVDTINLEGLEAYDFSNIDALVTTNAIETKGLPDTLEIIQVSPLFSEEDANKILTACHHKQNPVLNQNELAGIQFDVHSDKEASMMASYVFEQAKQILESQHSVTTDYIKSALDREKFSSTYIGNEMSIPHGDPEKVLKSHVIIFKNPQGFLWKQNKVKIAFFLAITQQDIPIMKKMIHAIAKLAPDDINQLLQLKDQQLKEYIIDIIQT
ncbi:BglG family transcription antiterminator [Staphylococcus sp. GSSP0090]|nr:BglG family transcription antiterminator [Staphylococcus sp. GSSP0090]